MKKRMVVMLALVALFIGAIGLVKFMQIRAAMAANSSFQPPPEAVTTVRASAELWPATISAIGSVTAVQGVTVSADLPGIVEKISFESGKPVRAGAVLVLLDTSQERAQLAAAEAQENLARLNLERMRGLREKGITSQAELDQAAAGQQETTARVGEIRATIERKTIRAPFDGIAGIRQVNLGQYLNSGDPVVPLQSLDPIYVNFGVPQQNVASLQRGAKVTITAEGLATLTFTGEISALDSVIDQATRNIQVQATLANPEGTLRPGMFVDVQVMLGGGKRWITLPASAISYAPYGDSVYIVEEMTAPPGRQGQPADGEGGGEQPGGEHGKGSAEGGQAGSYLGVRQQIVTLGATRGDQVAVLAGVKDGEEVVSSGAFKLRNGAAVMVDNAVQPPNEEAPKPEDG